MVIIFHPKQKLYHPTPNTFARLTNRFDDLVVQFRHSLSYTDSLPQLTLLGLVIGLFTRLIIVLFRLCIELSMEQFMPAGAESFEQLEPLIRVILIFWGAFVLWFFCILWG